MDKQELFKERRKYVRLAASVEVKYTVIGKPGAIKVFSTNVSAGGLCVLLTEQLQTDTPLQLMIKVPDLKEPIRALGRVVWQKKCESEGSDSNAYFETGIEFTGISDFDRFNINRYVIDHTESRA